MLWSLILQRIISIPTDTLLIAFLKFSKELNDFCGFNRVPHASQLTRLKKTYLLDLQSLFHHLVDVTEPICMKIDADKSMMTIFDTYGIEANHCHILEDTSLFNTRSDSNVIIASLID